MSDDLEPRILDAELMVPLTIGDALLLQTAAATVGDMLPSGSVGQGALNEVIGVLRRCCAQRLANEGEGPEVIEQLHAELKARLAILEMPDR